MVPSNAACRPKLPFHSTELHSHPQMSAHNDGMRSYVSIVRVSEREVTLPGYVTALQSGAQGELEQAASTRQRQHQYSAQTWRGMTSLNRFIRYRIRTRVSDHEEQAPDGDWPPEPEPGDLIRFRPESPRNHLQPLMPS